MHGQANIESNIAFSRGPTETLPSASTHAPQRKIISVCTMAADIQNMLHVRKFSRFRKLVLKTALLR
jgi:hypothetical protein